MTRVLVIVVTYNARLWIRQCLASIDTNRYDALVIDNLSADDTCEIIRSEYPAIDLIRNDENLGFGRANNIGLRRVLEHRYDHALLLNQDAWLEEDTIEQLVEKQRQHPEYWILSPLQKNSIENDLESQFRKYIIINKTNLRSKEIQQVDFVNAAIWLVSRECIETVGGFCPIFPHYGEDNNYTNRVDYFRGKVGVDTSSVGYHDRITKKPCSNRDIQISIKLLEISFLTILTNINHSLFRGYMKSLQTLITKCGKYLVHRNFGMIRTYVSAICRVIGKNDQVKKCRKTTRLSGAYLSDVE